MTAPNRAMWIVVVIFLMAGRDGFAQGDAGLAAKLAPIPPFPTAVAAAQNSGIPLTGIGPSVQSNALSPGDTVTALVTLNEKGDRRTQWLIYIQAATDTNKPSAEDLAPMVMYTSMGDKYEFSSSPATLRVRTVGPFADPKSRKHPSFKDKSADVSVNKDFLGIGLDRGAMAAWRWRQFDDEKKQAHTTFSFSVSGQAFGPAEVAKVRKQNAPLQMAPEEERAMAGWIPALTSYFGTVQETPNLSGILFKVLNLPSVWSMARNMGVKANIQLRHSDVSPVSLPAGWDWPSALPVYALPLTVDLNNRPALYLTLIATAPKPPLLVCGGIIGMVAENPSDKENYLVLRVISARCGNGAKQAR